MILKYLSTHLVTYTNRGIVQRNVLNLKLGDQNDKNYIHKANFVKQICLPLYFIKNHSCDRCNIEMCIILTKSV